MCALSVQSLGTTDSLQSSLYCRNPWHGVVSGTDLAARPSHEMHKASPKTDFGQFMLHNPNDRVPYRIGTLSDIVNVDSPNDVLD